MDGDDAVIGDEANPLEVVPEVVMRQFSESLAHEFWPSLPSLPSLLFSSSSSRLSVHHGR